jgi:hypothetical protein
VVSVPRNASRRSLYRQRHRAERRCQQAAALAIWPIRLDTPVRRLASIAIALSVLTACASSTPEVPDDAAPIDASAVDADPPDPIDGADPAVDALAPDADPIILDPSLPLIHDHSGAPREHVLALVRRALDGLGFDPDSGEGPSPQDRVFVGRHYLAWIDQTGFQGKMNGLWTLAGEGAGLDFVITDADGRPVNVFLPGENGEGRWPTSYKGAEHVEFPNRVVEAGDSCGGDWCNQYALNEAPLLVNDRIGHWTACNAGSISFATRADPVEVTPLADGIRLVYEGRLVKEADGDGTHDGDSCHADFLFPDRTRRPVYLRLGYELHGDQDYLDRTMSLRNPAGNPVLAGDMSLIGGFVMTGWPKPHYLKRLHRFWRPEQREIQMGWGDAQVTLRAGAWNDLSALAPVDRDVLVGWIDQPISLAATPAYGAGTSATLSHVGAIDNADVGACLCTVHGAIEMGGGLVHAGISLPIDGGQSTVEARRRLALPVVGPRPVVTGHTYEAEGPLGHGIGRVDGDGWHASTGGDVAGHLAYGPYATDWNGGSAQAVFTLKVDNNTAANDIVVTLEINDATADRVVAVRPVRRHDFRRAHTYQRFTLDVDLDGRAGHRMETRVYWHDVSYVKLDRVVVNAAATP